MNGRERLFAVLNGEEVDHVPVWLLFPYHPVNYYADVKNTPKFKPVIHAVEKYGITLNRRHMGANILSPEVKIEEKHFIDNGDQVHRITYTYKCRQLFSESRQGRNNYSKKNLLDSPEDIELFCSFPVYNDLDAIKKELDSQLPAYLKEKAEFPIELGAMMLDLGEPINVLYHNSNLEELAIGSIDEMTNQAITGFLDRVMENRSVVYNYCLERELADVYFMVGSELAAPPMFSEKTFQQWILPYCCRLNSMIHAHGGKVIQHFHGATVKTLLPYFLEMDADALHTIEAPPVGNCTMKEAFEVVGNRMALIGNIQYDDFRSFSKDEMRRAVITLLEETKGRRMILSPSAGPYDADVPDSFLENYIVMLETAWNFEWYR
ncbi:MAG: uroporphyrinogen decarboxylase family protein [Victivallaceae bacterium]|jgi:hypothetical protein